eukprot:Sspe_Gene.56308::Locus_30988_Transcript_1_1_Confidence_1.000_Length_3776::g.56308::m.56308/K04952/CNGB1; cyclic nucleotide gated channel beta 1
MQSSDDVAKMSGVLDGTSLCRLDSGVSYVPRKRRMSMFSNRRSSTTRDLLEPNHARRRSSGVSVCSNMLPIVYSPPATPTPEGNSPHTNPLFPPPAYPKVPRKPPHQGSPNTNALTLSRGQSTCAAAATAAYLPKTSPPTTPLADFSLISPTKPTFTSPRNVMAPAGRKKNTPMLSVPQSSSTAASIYHRLSSEEMSTCALDIYPEVTAIWSLMEKDAGFLLFDEVEELLDELGVVMEDWKAHEFFSRLYSTGNGKVNLHDFARTYSEFMQDGFIRTSSRLRLCCKIAVATGKLNTSSVVKKWHEHDKEFTEQLSLEKMVHLLDDLGLPSAVPEVRSLIEDLAYARGEQPKENGAEVINFMEFVELFADTTTLGDNTDDDRMKTLLREVRSVVDSMQHGQLYLTPEQREMDKLRAKREWYELFYPWVLFAYSQISIVVPIFLGTVLSLEMKFVHDLYYVSLLLLLSDAVLVWWVFMKFRLPRDNHGALVFTRSEIWGLYIGSREFVLDMITAFPLEVVVGVAYPPGFLHPLFRLNKLCVIFYMNDLFQRCFSPFLGPRWWRIVNALYWWAVLAHLVGCLFVVMARHEGDRNTGIMLTVHNFSELGNFHQYLQGYSYAINSMAGLSRGVFPSSDLGQLFALLVVFAGVWVYALVLAVVSYALSIQTQQSLFLGRLDEVKDVLGTEVAAKRLPPEFVQEALAYHRHVFATTGMLSITEDLLADVPLQLTVNLSLVTGKNTVGKVPIFSGQQENLEFVYALNQSLIPAVVPPNYRIIREGDYGMEMYFITHGCCMVLGKDDQPIFTLSSGDFFGEIALLVEVPRTATIVASTFCNVLVLQRDDFNNVMAFFPEAREQIVERAKERIRTMMSLKDKETRVTSRASVLPSIPNVLGKAASSVAEGLFSAISPPGDDVGCEEGPSSTPPPDSVSGANEEHPGEDLPSLGVSPSSPVDDDDSDEDPLSWLKKRAKSDFQPRVPDLVDKEADGNRKQFSKRRTMRRSRNVTAESAANDTSTSLSTDTKPQTNLEVPKTEMWERYSRAAGWFNIRKTDEAASDRIGTETVKSDESPLVMESEASNPLLGSLNTPANYSLVRSPKDAVADRRRGSSQPSPRAAGGNGDIVLGGRRGTPILSPTAQQSFHSTAFESLGSDSTGSRAPTEPRSQYDDVSPEAAEAESDDPPYTRNYVFPAVFSQQSSHRGRVLGTFPSEPLPPPTDPE